MFSIKLSASNTQHMLVLVSGMALAERGDRQSWGGMRETVTEMLPQPPSRLRPLTVYNYTPGAQ